MGDIHLLDVAIVAAYFGLVIALGRRAGRKPGTQGEEGFFLAGRKLGKVYQFFLNFGNSTDANNAVSTASLVYQQGASGAWLAFQMIFMNPYFWFMNLWFRRARLVTTADLIEDRLGSRSLSQFYAVSQSLAAVIVTIGFGNLVTYKICTALVVKSEIHWTAEERASVEGYRQLRDLEKSAATGLGDAESRAQLEELRERSARGELQNSVSPLRPLSFYLVYTLVIGGYIVLGGLAATAVNEIVQCLLIIAFSFMLLPVGWHAIGGVEQLRERVPDRMLEFFGAAGVSQVTGLTIAAVFAVSWVQITGIMGNMSIGGSARDEFSARFGAVSGTYAKRIMIIAWSFCGLIAYALYSGENVLSDPDQAWGMMSRQLLGPGLLGLMFAGVLAANMSSVAAQTMSVSALLVRNVWRHLRPEMSEREAVRAGRWIVVGVLGLGIVAAMSTRNIFTFFQLLLTINVPFGAAVLLMFFWRRLTVPAVWCGVVVSTLVNIVAPVVLVQVDAVRLNPALTVRVDDAAGRSTPVYFDTVARSDPANPQSALEGSNRFHTELYLLRLSGLPVESLSPGHRLAARFFFDAIFPFVLLLGVSLATRPPTGAKVDLFFGKMKTPVAPSVELDREEMQHTERDPRRFDHLKLFPRSSWEFTRWNRLDTLGFLACCAVSGSIVLLFWGLLQWISR
jgi:solute:Na+ symporter, SSS family